MAGKVRLPLASQLLLSALGLIGPFVQAQQMSAGIPSDRPTPGFLSADIGGRNLRYMCAGSGTPTVLVEQGMGVSVETVFSWDKPVGWAAIFPQITKVTRMCVYDRAGLGRSAKVSAPRTSRDVANDLHAMLDKIHIPPPYILAGQSLGGMNVRMFASEYPATVVGMILIDSAHPDQYKRIAEVLPPRRPDESAVLRGYRDGPDEPVMGEWFDFPANSALLRKVSGLGDKPLIVLTRSPKSPPTGLVPAEWEALAEPVWQTLQIQLATLSTNSKHIIVENAGHNIQFDQPQVVVDAILDVVENVRTRTKMDAAN
jgi:pimeloyl-ACP methyl ester carboxylesterase